MNSAVFTDYREIYQIKDKRVAPSSKFDEIAAKIKNTAKIVKRDWSSLSSEQQAELSNLAYTLLTPSTKVTFTFNSIWIFIRTCFFTISLAVTHQTNAFLECCDALNYLADTILDCIERSDSEYQAALSDTLEELRLNHHSIPEIKPEDISAWLQSLSDKATTEV